MLILEEKFTLKFMILFI